MLRPILAAMLFPVVAFAQPATVAYQGKLLDASGGPAVGTLVIQFTVFDAATGGSRIWCEQQNVGLTEGYYAVLLGAGNPCESPTSTPLPAAFSAPDRYLELVVAGSTLSPRQRVGSVPFAFVAASLANGDASFIRAQTASKQAAGFNIAGSAYVTGPAAFQGTGTVATTTSTAGVVGNGTSFGTEVVIGDLITINGESRHVAAVTDATHLLVDASWTATTAGLPYQVKKVVAQFNTYDVASASSPAALVVNQNGGVGIGTTNPAAKLDVVGSGLNSSVLLLRSGDPGVKNWLNGVMNLGQGGYNPLSQPGDLGLIFSGGSPNSGNLVIGPWSASAAGIRIASNGNVGIGTTTPAQTLHVAGRAYFEAAGVGINTEASGYPSLTVYHHRLDGADNGTTYPEFRIHGLQDTFIGSNAADWSVNLRIDGATYLSSDRRRKTNIETVQHALERVLALRGTSFNTITPTGEIEVSRNSLSPGGRRLGFIAQEVAGLVPEAVNYYPDEDRPNQTGFANAYSVDYGALTALLVEAVKDLDSQNRELRKEAGRCSQAGDRTASVVSDLRSSITGQQKTIDAQQARLEVQEAKIARLEALVAKLGARR